MIPKRGETNSMSPIFVPNNYLEMFPGFRAGKGNVDWVLWSSWVDLIGSSIEFLGSSIKEETDTMRKNPRDLQSFSQSYTGEISTVKEQTEQFLALNKTRNSLFPAVIVEKPHKSWSTE